MSDSPKAPALAVEYVTGLGPCYEWEGMHDCPERDALFADAYQTAHSHGPFSTYLPLLAAHRWLCTAEMYEGEQNPGAAARARGNYKDRVTIALASKGLLVRTAAERLRERGSCFTPR